MEHTISSASIRFRRIWHLPVVMRGGLPHQTPQLNLFQVTVSKNSVGSGYPMSRSFLYGE